MPDGHVEEKVEYRDENGKLLSEEEVAALEGKVSFSTRYETRTRLVDEFGNEVHDGLVEDGRGEAPAKPEGVDSQTYGREAGSAEMSTADAEEDLRKEKSVLGAETTAEPEAGAEEIKTKDEL